MYIELLNSGFNHCLKIKNGKKEFSVAFRQEVSSDRGLSVAYLDSVKVFNDATDEGSDVDFYTLEEFVTSLLDFATTP